MTVNNASRDENSIPTLLAVSNVDGKTPVKVWADPITHRLLVDTVAFSGAGAPGTTPSVIGMIYIDTSGNKVYISTNTTNSGGWALLN